MRDEVEVVGSVATGDDASALCASVRPDVVLMDYRMPGLNGAEATRAVLVACPETRVVCLSASVTQQEIDEVCAAGAVACVTKDEDFDLLVATVCEGSGVKLTAENTAVVLDSTADFPDAPARFPNFRVVPLYVRFGDESFRDYVEITPDVFYERLAHAPELPTTSQPTPGDFLAVYEELGAVRAGPLAPDLVDALRHVRERAVRCRHGRGAGARDRLAHRLRVARAARARRAAAARAGYDR